CIVEDRNGFFWISSNKGLFQVKEKSLLDYAAKKVTAIYYHYYNKDAGFLTNEFNGGCQPCATRLGSTVFFPSMSGVVTFNPEETSPNLPRYAIFIDEALIDNQKVSLGDTLYLNRKFDRITLFINSPYYGNNNNLNFEAKLEGDDYNEWTKVSDE